MLPKHWARRVKTQESLQRTLCRAGVLFCAVAPVLWLMAATFYWNVPWVANSYANQLAATISDQCGVSATIGELKYLAPNRVEIKNLKVANPETFEVILEVPSLIAERHASQWEVRMSSPQCALDQVLKLARMAHDRFLCRADDRLAKIHLTAQVTNLMDRGKSLWKGSCETLFNPSAQRTVLWASFSLDESAKQSIDVCFTRTREGQEFQTTTQLATKGMSVPMSLLRDTIPLSKYLGEEASFEGNAAWLTGPQEKMMISQSIIRNIRWDFATSQLAYQMTGVGNVYIDESVIEDGRVVGMRGILDASQGTIPNQWLAKAIDALRLRMSDNQTLGQGLTHEFRNIELKFDFANDGVCIFGGNHIKRPGDDWPLVVLSDANGPLIYEGARDAENNPARLPISQLIGWICASPRDQVGSNSVSQAAYQVPPETGHTDTVGAYLMTVLPSPIVKR